MAKFDRGSSSHKSVGKADSPSVGFVQERGKNPIKIEKILHLLLGVGGGGGGGGGGREEVPLYRWAAKIGRPLDGLIVKPSA